MSDGAGGHGADGAGGGGGGSDGELGGTVMTGEVAEEQGDGAVDGGKEGAVVGTKERGHRARLAVRDGSVKERGGRERDGVVGTSTRREKVPADEPCPWELFDDLLFSFGTC